MARILDSYGLSLEVDGRIRLRRTGDTIGYLNGGYRNTPSINSTSRGVYVYVDRGLLGLKTYRVESIYHGVLALLQLHSDKLRSKYSGLIRKLILAVRAHSSSCIDEDNICRLVYRGRGCVKGGYRIALALAIYALSRYNVSRSSLDPDVSVLVREGMHEIKSPMGLYATTALSVVKTLSCSDSDLRWAIDMVKTLSDRARSLLLNGRLGPRLIDLLTGQRGLTESILALISSLDTCGGSATVILRGPQQHVSPVADTAPLLGISQLRIKVGSAIESLAACTAAYLVFKHEPDTMARPNIIQTNVEECLIALESSDLKLLSSVKARSGILIGRPETLANMIAHGVIDLSYYGGSIATTGRLAALMYNRDMEELKIAMLRQPKSGFDSLIAVKRRCVLRRKPYPRDMIKKIVYNGECVK